MYLRMFAAEPSVEAGATLRLRVATNVPRYRIRLERWGGGDVCAREAGPFRGVEAEPGAAGVPWDWPEARIALPRDLAPGAYVARALFDHCAPPSKGPRPGSPDARWGTALFVVRGDAPAQVLVNLPLFTYHATNTAHVDRTLDGAGGDCLEAGTAALTLARPGGGTGGHTWHEADVDVFDRRSPRETFAHWDLAGLDWFARAGIAVDVCTDLDLERGTIDWKRYALYCSFGRDAYWTLAKRRAVERFVDDGGAAAFFGGDTCRYRVRFDERNAALEFAGTWDDEPQDALTGVSHRRGGGKRAGGRLPGGYRIVAGDEPLVRAAGLCVGDTIGTPSALIGFRCDGIDPQRAPQSLRALGHARIDHWNVRDGSGEVGAGGHAAMAVFERGAGIVFNAGTVDWSRALGEDDAQVDALTRAVVETFAARRTNALYAGKASSAAITRSAGIASSPASTRSA